MSGAHARGEASCAVPPRDASLLARARAFVVCRPCLTGWAIYLVAAIVVIALWG